MPEDEEPLRTEIPEWLQDCYKFDGELIAEFHDEDGQLKTYAFVPPNGWRRHDIDEWYFEWGDIAGGDYPKSIPQFIFEELVEERKREYEQERKSGNGAGGAARELDVPAALLPRNPATKQTRAFKRAL
jgi:hypothetical protein